ncbi:MAG: hypothetical protein ACO38I_03965 [Ilumatobacteraceae bacterium]
MPSAGPGLLEQNFLGLMFKHICSALFSPLSASFEESPDKRALFKIVFRTGFSAMGEEHADLSTFLSFLVKSMRWEKLHEEYKRTRAAVEEMKALIIADDKRKRTTQAARAVETRDLKDPASIISSYL